MGCKLRGFVVGNHQNVSASVSGNSASKVSHSDKELSYNSGRRESSPAGKSDQGDHRYLLTVKEASGWLGISVFTIYSWAQGRKLPHYKIGKRVMFSKDELKRWLEEHRVTETG